jgi:orotidine-5'-phosphate decarboxylase
MAFYEVLGKKGFEILEKTMDYIPEDIIIILDGKRNDIGNTARKYAKSLFETYKADAITINPLLGKDSVQPFLEYKDKCSFILCRTSNPSSADFQELRVSGMLFFEAIANKIKDWNKFGNCGAVVGATYPEELKKIRDILGEDIPFLIPGVGAQGGDVEKTVKYGTNEKGEMAVINSSRGVIYSGAKSDFDKRARDSAASLRDEINKYR